MSVRPPDDRRWMRRALALARLGEGQTRPNPPVGAVVVRGGRRLGEGRHRCAGRAHAEVEAFDACRGSVRGATLYVTLEPCCTQGRTPPCTDRILREGIARVVVGCRDENGCHCGRGLELLAGRGVEVVCGVCEDEARELARPFFKHVTTGLPFVTLKLAMTLDGRIADRAGTSQWITGEAARAEVQRMRRRADAVLVGAGTVCADDPSLLCRLPGAGGKSGARAPSPAEARSRTGSAGGSPAEASPCSAADEPSAPPGLLRVVVDARGLTPPRARVLTDDAAHRTIVATLRGTAAGHGPAWKAHGARVWQFPSGKEPRIPLKRLLKKLGDEGCLHVLCEGGGQLAGALHDAGLVDEYAFFYAPAVLGDARALSGVAGCGTLLDAMPRLRIKEVRRLGEDVLIRARPR